MGRFFPLMNKSVYQWARKHQLHNDKAFMRFLDGQLLISAQTTSKSTAALYGATALDLPRQGIYEVEGGIGNLAKTLVTAIERYGGKVQF
ncbi:MAG: amine oxidase, partial [Phototrophicales bacterium]